MVQAFLEPKQYLKGLGNNNKKLLSETDLHVFRHVKEFNMNIEGRGRQ